MKAVGRRRTQPLEDLRNRRRYLELKEEAEDRKRWKDSLSIEHKEEIRIFHKSMDLIISNTLNNYRELNVILVTQQSIERQSLRTGCWFHVRLSAERLKIIHPALGDVFSKR